MVKIKRTFPAPSSLETESKKVSGTYNKPDVVEQLAMDFHNKCYICELKELQDPQVEHLLPHKNGQYPERKFDWNNLFWACGHCNGVKNQEKYDCGIVDCCNQDPEKLISFRLENGEVNVLSKDSTDEKSVLTADLVYEVFNTTNTGMRVRKSALRLKELNKEMNILYDTLEDYRKKPNSIVVQKTLAAILRRESAFAAFKRCYVRENINKFPQLKEYIV